MSFMLRPAVRENTPLIVGIAGPTKSGKTYSALRLAGGLAPGGKIVMLNAEGARGHQYADTFSYIACDIAPPFSPARYDEALREIAKAKPGVVIVDSASHMHDGPGGLIEEHEQELDRMAGTDQNKRHRATWAAWIKPKKAENLFIYTMLSLDCPIILAFRAKEKLRIVPGRDPIDLGWQPIAGDRITFETIFTLVLPPHSKGVPDLDASEMRSPFDKIVPKGQPIDETLGKRLAEWARGGHQAPSPIGPPAALTVTPDRAIVAPVDQSPGSPEDDRAGYIATIDSANQNRVAIKKRHLFNDDKIDHRTLELSSLKTLALAVKG